MTQKQGTYQRTITIEVVEGSEPNLGIKLSNILPVSGVVIALLIIVFGLSQTFQLVQKLQLSIIFYLVTAAYTLAGFYVTSLIVRLLVDIKLELRAMNGKKSEAKVAAYSKEMDDENKG